ncbi:hypothetical protein CDV31_016006 [Fusarium ambrosium]|uniref:Uncharacterized protein n=1 Tax=Fusarium ambrosium TaxID=131363 RepID=A0A428SG43_9HYPO|nr:hypothetical protein CDV31_016006 [Fusarium ambrosium]
MSELEILFNDLSNFLLSEWRNDRLPYKFRDSHKKAQSAPNTDTSRIFLDHSFQAWVAYFIIRPKTSHANGQAAQRELFTKLDERTIEERGDLAKRIAAQTPHPTVANLIQNMASSLAVTLASGPSRIDDHPTTHDYLASPSRTHACQQADPQIYHCTPRAEIDSCVAPSAATVPSKRRRIGGGPIGHEYLASPPNTHDCYRADPHMHHHPPRTDVDSNDTDQDVTSGADIEALGVFPEYLRDAIRRDSIGDRQIAAVSMNFPPNVIGDVDCAMTMEVLPNKVERLGMLLFDAHLETNGRVRELLLPGGTTAIVYRLEGSRPKRISDVFGDTIAAAIRSAPYRRREELEKGVDSSTRCVWMSEFRDVDKGATITLTLGRRNASQIFERLFKSKLRSRYAVCPSVQMVPIFCKVYLLSECFTPPQSPFRQKTQVRSSKVVARSY